MNASNPSAPIYLDNAATTPVRPAVAEAISRVYFEDFGNPSSRHGMGLSAEEHLRSARRLVATATGAAARGVIFTSGGTEANAMGLLGASRRIRAGQHVLISAVEHPSILETARQLEREGHTVDRIPVTVGGWVDPDEIQRLLRPETALVAVMHVNNETGVEQPVADIIRRIRARNPDCIVLVDAVQSFTHLPTRLDQLGADLLSISAHKIHGPKGIGCLVAGQRVKLAPLWGGGDQESGLRPGTENLPGIVGLARALELALEAGGEAPACAGILDAVIRARAGAHAVGDAGRRVPHILSVAIPDVRAEVLANLLEERGLIVSTGSACHSRRSLRSHVQDAMSVPAGHGVVRFSTSRLTTPEEMERAEAIVESALNEL